MNWDEIRNLIAMQKSLEGTLFRGVENQGTIIYSSEEELEIGPINWELPKKIKFVRSGLTWFYEVGINEWVSWDKAEEQSLGAFALLDPRYYLNFDKVINIVSRSLPYEGVNLQVSFASQDIFEPLRFPKELVDWYTAEILGESYEVSFIFKNESLRAISSIDFWLTEEPNTVIFQKHATIPGQLLSLVLG